MSKNLLVGLVSSVWVAVIGLAVIPQYLNYLGNEAYGLIGFFVTTQAVLQLLDMGMAPTVNREVARCTVSGKMHEARSLLHTLAVVYWAVAVVIAISLILLAPFIAESWLNAKHLSFEEISLAVMLMGLVIACRWPIGLYQGAIIGAHRLAISSCINVVMVTLSSLGTVGVLAFISPTLEAFFVWQALIGLLYAISMRWAAWKIIGKGEKKFSLERLKGVWRFSAGMGVIALSSVVFMQIDKIILSKIISLEEFGHYMLATVVVSAIYLFVTPIFNIIYPKFSALIESKDDDKLKTLYRLGSRSLAMVLFPAVMLLVIFSKDLVTVWTDSSVIAESVAPLIALLGIGAALHGVMYFPFALQIAHGKTKISLKINVMLIILFIPLIIVFTQTYGAIGGAIAWLVLHVFYMVIGTWMTHRCFLKGLGTIWLFQDVGAPLFLSILVGCVGYGYYEIQLADSLFLKLLAGLGMVMIVFILSLSRQLRIVLSSRLR